MASYTRSWITEYGCQKNTYSTPKLDKPWITILFFHGNCNFHILMMGTRANAQSLRAKTTLRTMPVIGTMLFKHLPEPSELWNCPQKYPTGEHWKMLVNRNTVDVAQTRTRHVVTPFLMKGLLTITPSDDFPMYTWRMYTATDVLTRHESMAYINSPKYHVAKPLVISALSMLCACCPIPPSTIPNIIMTAWAV